MLKRAHLFSPSRSILLSMVVTIIIGTILLTLPFSRNQEIPLIDLFFTATSSTCVTGLLTIPLSAFSNIGLWVIMILMQIGGLGLVTLSLFVVSLFMNLGLATQVVAGEMLDLESWKETRRIILFIIGMTFIVEGIGTIFIFQSIKHLYPFWTALFYALFHSISAFCNAGLTLFPNDLVQFSRNPLMLISISVLMFIGGFGFISWKEIFIRIKTSFSDRKAHLSLQTRIVLRYYGGFTFINMFLFWILEHANTFASMSTVNKWINAFFMSVSCRSGGYFSVYPHDMQNASILNVMLNAFIGTAPGSTGSGIKLTTFALVVAVINTVILHKHSVEIKGRKIMTDQIYRALSIIILSIFWTVGLAFLLLISERNLNFMDVLFESVSAFSTLGASIGITASLSSVGKLLISLSMLVGRIGVITLLLALKTHQQRSDYTYPEERVMLT